MSTRQDVYAALDSERDYQDMRISRDGTTAVGPEHYHTPEEFLLYMDYYLNLAKQTASTVWGSECKPAIMEIVRKITALGVANMEANGAPKRVITAA